MIATLIAIKKFKSFIMPCFKLNNGESAKSYLVERYGNFQRWRKVLDKGIGVRIEGFRLLNDHIIDADSEFKVIEE